MSRCGATARRGRAHRRRIDVNGELARIAALSDKQGVAALMAHFEHVAALWMMRTEELVPSARQPQQKGQVR